MSTTVSESDTFPEAIPAPTIGDKFTYVTTIPDAFTRLASRARWAYNRVNELLALNLDGRLTTIEEVVRRPGLFEAAPQTRASGTKVHFAENFDPASDYSMHSGTDLFVERNGYYWVDFTGNVDGISTGIVEFRIRVNAGIKGITRTYFDYALAPDINYEQTLTIRTLVHISDFTVESINVLTGNDTNASGEVAISSAYLTIERAQ